MSSFSIVKFGDPVLRETAKPVKKFNKKLRLLIDDMADILRKCEDGAALAAPQIGISERVIVIDYEGEYIEMVNPEIFGMQGVQTEYEGCLSFPGYIGKVTRFHYIKVRYQDRNGSDHVIERAGRMATCIQHECDHLDGILFVDRMIEENLLSICTESILERKKVLLIAGKNS